MMRFQLRSVFVGFTAVALALTAGVTVAPAASAAPTPALSGTAQPTFDTTMVALINQARAANGRPALAVHTGLRTVALNWSLKMDAGGTGYQLQHNPSAMSQVRANGAANLTVWGENVGWGSSPQTSAKTLFDAYMASPGHRANILSASYRYIGSGSVSGAHGMWNTLEFTDKVQTTAVLAATQVVVRDGDFVSDPASRSVYRIAGGAPLIVTNWAAMGGAKPVRALTAAQFAALPKYPRDGTYLLGSGGLGVFVVAGGAPIYVQSWGTAGGWHASLLVDAAAIRQAGGAGVYSHLRARPADGTFVLTGSPRQVFRFVGGAPEFVSTWSAFGGAKPTTMIDAAAIRNSGGAGNWSHVAKYPADNTYIKPYNSSRIYRVLSGKAVYLSSWSLVGGPKPVTTLDAVVFNHFGTAPYDHLRGLG